MFPYLSLKVLYFVLKNHYFVLQILQIPNNSIIFEMANKNESTIQKFTRTYDLSCKNRWVWHVVFWLVYGIIQSRAYYITVLFYHKAYVEYMYVQDLAFVVMTYFTIYLYRKIFVAQKIGLYLCLGIFILAHIPIINVSFKIRFTSSPRNCKT